MAQLGEEASLAYLEPGAVEMRGPLDLPALCAALRQAAGRHEALRAVVPEPEGGEPVQVFLPQLHLEVPLIDVSALPPARREEAAVFWLEAEARRPFDLARGPLVRTSVLRLEPRRHRLGLFVHHIAADGLSLGILLDEVFAVYEAARAGCRAALPAPMRYRDYVAWLAAGGGQGETDEAWWLEQLAAPLPVFEPPTDRPRPPVRSFRGSRRRRALAPALRDGLRQLGRRQGATLYAGLLAVWSVLLHRWTGQDDLIVGGPTARRPLEGGDRLVGHCVDLVPYRSRLDGEEPSFVRYLAAVRSRVLDVQEHGGVSFARLIRLLRLPYDPGRAPLIQAVFNFDSGLGTSRAAGLELAEVSPAIPYVKFDVALHVLESAEAPLLQLDYRTDLFDAPTLDRLLERLLVLVAGAVATPEAALGDLPLLPESERSQVLLEWSGESREFPSEVPVHRVFEQMAQRQPDAPAVFWESPEGERSLSYGELARNATRLARRLRSLGVGPDVPVVLDLPRSPQMVTAMVAVLQAGGFYVPLDPADSSERRSYLLADSRAAVRVDREMMERIEDFADKGPFESSPLGGDTLAYVLYTSGSTGRPKGVGIPHRAIDRLVLATDYFRLGPGDRITNLVNTAFDVTTWEIWGALLLGAAIVVVPREVVLEPMVLADWLERFRIRVSYLPVPVYNEITREKPWALSPVRELFSGGEALTPRWIRESLPYIAPGHRLVNGYGPTECTCYALTHSIASLAEGRSVPIGRPIPNTTAYVLDRGMRPLPVGVAGELCLGGPGLARGYWHRPELTAERFVPNPFGAPGERLYRTGDLSRWLPDGTVEYLGRTDHQVKVRGYRIELGEIEVVLARCPGVLECAVIVLGESEGKRLVAFVSPEEGAAAPDVRGYLRARLPEYMVPAQVVFHAPLPTTPSGKIDRRALLSLEVAAEPEEGPYEAPRTPVEEVVAGAWAEVLQAGRVGLGESFFDLGGHSLLAGRVLARLRTAFGIELPLPAFFREPTVEGLARRIEEVRQEGRAEGLAPLRRVSRDERIPLSFSQEGLWILDRLVPGSALYNMPVVLRIDGPLRVASLIAALGEIVRRHEALRTVFGLGGGEGDEPVQRILPEIPGTAVVDLSALPGPLRRAEAGRQERDVVRRPFSLETGPLFRPLLLCLSAGEHFLVLDAHHIVTDGWSVAVFSQELEALYRGEHGEPLPELGLRYADFCVWQREHLQGGFLEEQLTWWKEHLAGLPEGLDLPADRPRPAVQSYRGSVARAELPAPLFQALLHLGQQHGATPFMVLAAAFLTLIHRHTEREDLAVGVPSANRTRPDFEPLIGLFVNTVVLRADLSGNPGFRDLLGRVRGSALGAWAHQDLPFDRLVEELAPERDLSRTPLIQVIFAYQGTLLRVPRLAPEISVRLEEPGTGTSKVDLSLFLSEGAGGELRAEMEYSTDLFDDATVRRLLERLEILLGGIVAAPAVPLGELPLLGDAERRQVLEAWSGSETAYPRELPIHEVFARVAQRQPGSPAVIWEEGSLTYAELDRWSQALARRLRDLGVGPEVPVALDLERSPELVVAMLAVLRAGGFYVPLDPADSSERRAWLLADSRATVRLEAQDVKDCKDNKDTKDESSLQSLQSFGSFAPLALAYVLYTSGSSGTPKGVAVPHRAINRLVLETDYVQLGPGDRTAHLSNTAFDASTFEVWGALLTGAALVVMPREVVLSPAALGAAFQRWDISASFLTAALFNEVLREAPGSLAGVRHLLAGGEALSPRWVREALSQAEPGSRALNGYGPTECTTFAVVHEIRSAPEGHSIPIGRPIANTRAWVVDREMRPVPPGVAGELLLGGDGLARGYWQRPELSAERFVPAPFGPAGARVYRTGDLVRWLGDGTLEFLGRTDEQVKVRGFRIEPGEIESVLSRCPGVGECAVVAHQEGEGKVLVAFATRTGEAQPDVRGYLRERLPEHMVPSRVAFVDALPRTPSGKVDRRALKCSSVESSVELSVDVRAPRTPVEEILAGIWAEVLGLEQVGLRDSFFDLGGHSLLAGRVLARLHGALGVDLPMAELFLEPTVEGLARRAGQALGGGERLDLPPLRPLARRDGAPLSFAQQRLWFFDRLAPASALYNMPVVLRIAGPLRVAPLAAAVAEIVRRHESLRTVFAVEGDEPVQRILPQIPGLTVVDLSALPDPRAEAIRQEREELRRPFSLETGPLFRALLLRLGPDEHRLILNAHHIVSDGWSLGVLSHELEELYRGERGEPLPELPIQYVDFAVWQREWLQGGALEEQLAWWRKRLAGLPEGLDLPADRLRPAVQSYRGAVEAAGLAADPVQALLRLGRRHGATPFMTLAAVFLALIQRHTDREDLAVGFPSANRTRPEIEPLIGFFVNTLVLRADLAGEPGFLTLLGRVREAALGAWAYQDLPFERLVEALAPERDLSRSPLVQVFFAHQHDVRVEPRLAPDLSIRMEEVDTGTSKFDLSLFLQEDEGGGLVAQSEYSSDLFEAGTIRRFLERFGILLEGVVAAPETPVGELPLLSAAELSQVTAWHGVAREYPSEVPVHRIFEQVAERQPGAPAVIWDSPEGERSLSYGELARDAARLAGRLRSLGVGPGVPVALDLPRSPEMITAMLAVLQAGGFYVPLDPADTSERRAFLLEDSGVAVVLSSKDFKDDKDSKDEEALESSPLGGDALAYMIYTSGSTGRPKGVAVPHRAINRLVLATDYFRLGPGDRITNLVNMTFDVSTWEVWGGLLLGAAVVVVPRELVLEPPVLANWLVRMRADVCFLPVSVFNEVVRERPGVIPSIRELFSGGEALTPRWVRAALPHVAPGHRLVNGYGPTECTCWALTHRVESLEEGRSVPIGRPIPNTTSCVLDRGLRPVPVGVPGELCLGGPGVAQGYRGRPELTAERFVPDPFGAPGARLYRTGDLSRWLPDGTVEYLGRTDHQVKVRGYRIELGEIEAVLARCPGVAECAVVVAGDSEARRLVAFVASVAGEPDVRGYLRQRLPEHMVPAQVAFHAPLPKTSSGKIDRRALQCSSVEPSVDVRVPRTPVEEIVAGVWAEVLGVERVGLGEGFFDLGGHSLLAGRVLARLRTAFGVDLPLRAFFLDPTVGGLARWIEETQGGAAGLPPLPSISPVPRDGRLPLSFAQQRLWLADRLAPASALYNLPLVLRLDGPLRVASLAAAVGEIARRHEALRTVVILDGDEPVQRILPQIPGLAVVDLSALPEPRAEAERQERDEVRRPFSLETGPLFRPLLLRVGPHEHRLILNAHHIVSDGWSLGVLTRELEVLYRGEHGEPLPELAVQYADFAVWQREHLRGELLEEQLAWWTERLAGLPAGLDLPADRPRPAVQSYRGGVERSVLPAASAQALLRLGRRHGATPFMTLAAAFLALIHHHTHREDLAVAFPSANRTRPEIEPLIGFFVNTLVLRADLSGEPGFLDLLGRVCEAALGAWMHQDLPFERLVEALAPERDLSRSPLVQVLFAYQEALAVAPDLAPDLTASLEDVDTGTAKLDLGLFLREEDGGGLAAEVEYSTDLFAAGTVRRFLERLGVLLDSIVAAPDTPLSELPLLGDAERRQVLEAWSGSETAYPREMPIHEVFARVAQRQPGAPAVIWEGQSLTYAELDRWSQALARRLRALGVGPEVPVALDLERSPELIVAMLAVLRAGGFYVPLDPADSSERRAWLLADSRATVRLEAKDVKDCKDTKDDSSLQSFGSLALAYVLYTSGSTGRPKGVAVPHRAINRLVLETDYVRLGPGDRTAHLSNTAFDASTFEVWGALLTGAALVVIPREVVLSPAALGAAFRRWEISASFLTAALFNEVLREAPGSLAGVRHLLAGGEALSPRWVREALLQAEPGSRLLNGYGPTECTTFAVVHEIRSAPEGHSIPIGRPIANTRAWVVDREMRPVPPGVAGELLLGGDGLARGYWQRPELSAERFVPAPFGALGARVYRTGDLVRWLGDGTLEFLGRTDEQVKVRGFRIEPGEIESVLSRCPGVGECVVVARQEGEAKVLVAFATRTGEARPDVRPYLRERLPEYMVPSRVAFVEALPRTPSGKVDRRALQCSSVPASVDVRVPRTPLPPIPEIVAGIWAEVLGLDRVGLGQSFFDLGGHSLLASRTLARLRSTLGVDLPLRTFFLDPTVDGVARRVEEMRRSGDGIAVPPIPRIPKDKRDRGAPLSFAQERLWLVDQLQPGNTAYNSFLPLTLAGGPLDGRAVEAALAEIVRRHESLRTRFVAGPRQVVDPPAAWRLPRIDLSGLPAAARHEERLRLVVEEAYRPFDLARGPLFRAALVLLGEGEHALLLSFHHIVCDGWSLTEVLPTELGALYRAFRAGRPSPLPELPVQYADFAAWQREHLAGGALEEQLAWWRERLGGEPPVLDLPYDRPRPAAPSSRGTVEIRVLPAALGQDLAVLGRRHGATLFMTLLAAIQTLLQRYCDEDRIAVGTAVGNRSRHETEGLIGLFLNTLVLVSDLSGDPSFRGLLERVREVTLAAFDHQDLPFERLVAAVQGHRDAGRSPLFQVLFLLQNMRMSPLDLPGLTAGVVEYPAERVQFDLAFTAFEWDEGLVLAVPYSTDLFDRPTIRRLLDHAQRLLEAVAEDPERPLSEVSLLSEAERHQIRVERPWALARTAEAAEEGQTEPLQAKLERRQQQVSESLDKLSPQRRALLRKWIGKSKPDKPATGGA